MPSNSKKKLPRLREARPGELNLESVADEKIDAVTSEPLNPNKYVEVVSPDGTLRLFYNTSTLIRIAEDKGGFVQPPHFREPMEAELRDQIERLEGKKFRFEARDVLARSGALDEDVVVMHRHVYFQQIVDEFYSLNPADVYICPVCFEHYVKTRYIPFLRSEERHIDFIDDGATAVIDPLDVLTYMHTSEPQSNANDCETSLIWLVFRTAAHWKMHMSRHHCIKEVSARDYRVRDVLCSFYNHFNQLQEEKYQEQRRKFGQADKKPALTQQRYWQLNGRYNCLRYNRIVDRVTLATEKHGDAIVEKMVFPPGEAVGEELNPVEAQVDDSSFINDDEESQDNEFVPHFVPNSELTHEQSETRSLQAPRGRGKRQSPCQSSRSTSSASDLSSDYDTESDNTAQFRTGRRVASDKSRAQVRRKEDAPMQGFFAKQGSYYERLSAEDKHFLATATRRPVAPSQLYDPIQHRLSAPRGVSDGQMISAEPAPENEDEIDWENIGGSLTPNLQGSHAPHNPPAATPRRITTSRSKLLLETEEQPVKTVAKPFDTTTPVSSTTVVKPASTRRIMMDEDFE